MVTSTSKELSAVVGNQVLELSLYDDAWTPSVKTLNDQYPLVVFSKTYCPFSKRGKALLESYKLVPPPKVVEVDLRGDGTTIQTILGRLTGRRTVPNVVLKGNSIGGSDDIHALHAQGKLKPLLESAGIKVTGI
ncbi:glutaredoxin [Punctularia strigosozonata HHB-11173 SS5]|uniref:glutaredoxin n=1 Tax=Punctularia strigosozonata (strain HHB-11173) TaxID=741275 RepID=UPI00044165B8|nr:glutaredoxin [Punctularia strigosozonata HHB-11173 SS5]EIN11418.1 glutaredoxin [Punctularia strigosozonata HHB-11173 SS5]